MQDIKFFEEQTDFVKENLGKRGFDANCVDQALELNSLRKKKTQQVETNRASIKSLSKEVAENDFQLFRDLSFRLQYVSILYMYLVTSKYKMKYCSYEYVSMIVSASSVSRNVTVTVNCKLWGHKVRNFFVIRGFANHE